MFGMFQLASVFDTDLSSWNVSSVTTFQSTVGDAKVAQHGLVCCLLQMLSADNLSACVPG